MYTIIDKLYKTMDNSILEKVKLIIENDFTSCISKHFSLEEEKHNHPPVRFLVDDCDYCKKYGNVLVKHVQ